MPETGPSDAARLLARLGRAGAWLEVDGDQLRYRGPAAPTEEVRAELRRLKPDLVAWLTAPAWTLPDEDLVALDYAPEPWLVPNIEQPTWSAHEAGTGASDLCDRRCPDCGSWTSERTLALFGGVCRNCRMNRELAARAKGGE